MTTENKSETHVEMTVKFPDLASHIVASVRANEYGATAIVLYEGVLIASADALSTDEVVRLAMRAAESSYSLAMMRAIDMLTDGDLREDTRAYSKCGRLVLYPQLAVRMLIKGLTATRDKQLTFEDAPNEPETVNEFHARIARNHRTGYDPVIVAEYNAARLRGDIPDGIRLEQFNARYDGNSVD